MDVIVNKNSRTCHKPGCFRLQNANPQNLRRMTLREAEKVNYEKCEHCLWIEEYIKSVQSHFKEYEEKYHMIITYDNNRFIYVQTQISFWKIYINYDLEKFQLFHLSEFSEDLSFEKMTKSKFHRQTDVKATDSLGKIISYIGEHDKSKPIREENYQNLLRNTKRRRKYYQIAKRQEMRKEQQRIDELFELIKT